MPSKTTLSRPSGAVEDPRDVGLGRRLPSGRRLTVLDSGGPLPALAEEPVGSACLRPDRAGADLELYDLAADPGETRNVYRPAAEGGRAGEAPVAADRIEKLRQALEA